MATYVIGDVQGCLLELKDLLALIDYKPGQDRLGFAGDLVNRGPDSLQTLRFIKQLDNPIVILGNHDLCLLALYYGAIDKPAGHALNSIVQAEDGAELIAWLRQQKMMAYLSQYDMLIVHAGIPPQWNQAQALGCAQEVEHYLHGDGIQQFLVHMYGDEPACWDENLGQWDRLRYIVNALTRMRFCNATGELDVANKTTQPTQPKFKPWFEWYSLKTPVVFGHWAALKGRSTHPDCYAIDTGCVWGGSLTALRLEDHALFSVPSR